MNTEHRRVICESSILPDVDILGVREMIATRTAGDISPIRVVREAQGRTGSKTSIPEIPKADSRNFADLCERAATALCRR